MVYNINVLWVRSIYATHLSQAVLHILDLQTQIRFHLGLQGVIYVYEAPQNRVLFQLLSL